MKTIVKNCLNCNNEFNASLREVKRGNGKFCNLLCACKYNGAKRPKPKDNTECAWCNKPLYRNPSKAALSKSGLYFCSDEHKNFAQSIDGLKQMHLPHYGQGKNYRDKVFKLEKKLKICERCGYDKNELAIIVHHKDRNRDNNDITNLEILCCNCHAIEHWGATD